jgi:signal transduction histidine kinase
MATWWGIGLPFSLFGWLLDAHQRWWVLICYAWEVPVAGLLGPVLVPLLWFRALERRWDRVFSNPDRAPAEVAGLEAAILDFPIRVAWVFVVTSLVGYGVGALQLRVFAQIPTAEICKVGALGLVTGLIGGLFAYLYLEWLLAPLLRRIGALRLPPGGRRVPLFGKVFAGSVILTVMALLLLGTIFYSRGERVLEEELGRRLLVEARALASDLSRVEADAADAAWWRERADVMELGPSGSAYLVDGNGTVLAGASATPRLTDEGFRPAVARAILGRERGFLVDRVYTPRIVAFAPLPDGARRIVTVVYRREFEHDLDSMLARGSVVFGLGLLLAMIQGFLFSRRLTRPIEVLTEMASQVARTPQGPWEAVVVRTNDEVGELAMAFNQMTARLEEARAALERYSAELERRVAEATRNIGILYDVTRTTTSTLEIDEVLELVAEKTLGALGAEHVVLLWRPEEDSVVDGYAAAARHAGTRFAVEHAADLGDLCPDLHRPTLTPLAALQPQLPPVVAERLAGPSALCLPLVYKDTLLGVILASFAWQSGAPDVTLAAALAGHAAVALANASLFETARRHEVELRRLSQRREQLQEQGLRTLSRELHDNFGQRLTAIKLDLGLLDRAGILDAATLGASIRAIQEQVAEMQKEVRSMSQLLRPSMLDDFGLIPTLQWFVEQFTSRTCIAVTLRTPSSDTRLPPAIEVLLYRVTQEALTNVVKHAHAQRVDLELSVCPTEIRFAIADDGVGFDVERLRRTPESDGVGLLGMRERVAHYRGRIDIRSRPHAGVRIELSIPIEAEADQRASLVG